MKIPFTKYCGCGNDFILVDNLNKLLPSEGAQTLISAITRHLCNRHAAIGADGVILLEHCTPQNKGNADFRMRIFNADGSEAEMCGNGIRCLARFIKERHPESNRYLIETMVAIIPVEIEGENILVSMPDPCHFKKDLEVEVAGRTFVGHSVDTGVPHFVIFVDDIADDSPLIHAKQIRRHTHFPKGTNVNFVKVVSPSHLIIRTYERGVEKETEACGTGACASALMAAASFKMANPIHVETRSKEILSIEFEKDRQQMFRQVKMKGPAIKTFSGEISLVLEA
jgi:diaminopimelate epimerase